MTKRQQYMKEYRVTYRAAHSEQIAEYQVEYRAAYNAAHRAEIAWENMHQRAENKNGKNPTYTNVKVCRRWSGPRGKENFVKDMGQPPKGTSLGRYCDSGTYKPSNCKWMTRAEQGLNRSIKMRIVRNETWKVAA